MKNKLTEGYKVKIKFYKQPEGWRGFLQRKIFRRKFTHCSVVIHGSVEITSFPTEQQCNLSNDTDSGVSYTIESSAPAEELCFKVSNKKIGKLRDYYKAHSDVEHNAGKERGIFIFSNKGMSSAEFVYTCLKKSGVMEVEGDDVPCGTSAEDLYEFIIQRYRYKKCK